MDLLGPVHRFDRVQQRHAWLAIPCATIKKFGDDSAGNLAALVAYYGFLSLFPLLLVFITILGYVLAGDHTLLNSIQSSVLSRFPVIGDSVKAGKLHGSVPALVIGLLISLLSGLGVMQSCENALNTVWDVPRKKRPNFLQSRLHALIVIVGLGVMFIVASGASGVVTGGLGGTLEYVAGILISLALNIAVFLLSFKVLCAAELPWKVLVPGAVLAAVIWTMLQLVGGAYVNHIKSTSSAYGTFALVLGVIAWLHLGAQLTMYSAELNAVIVRHKWPRSLFGDDSAEDGEPENTADEHLVQEHWPLDDGTQRRVSSIATEQSDPATGQPPQTARPG